MTLNCWRVRSCCLFSVAEMGETLRCSVHSGRAPRNVLSAESFFPWLFLKRNSKNYSSKKKKLQRHLKQSFIPVLDSSAIRNPCFKARIPGSFASFPRMLLDQACKPQQQNDLLKLPFLVIFSSFARLPADSSSGLEQKDNTIGTLHTHTLTLQGLEKSISIPLSIQLLGWE